MKLKYNSNELVFMQYIAGMNAIGERVQLVVLTKMIRSYDMRECYLTKTVHGDFNKEPDSLAENVRYAKFLLNQFEIKFQANYKMYLAVYNHVNENKNENNN
jgi:hypothetical protein